MGRGRSGRQRAAAGPSRPARWGWAWLDLATYPLALLLLAPLFWRLAAIISEFLGRSFAGP